jgi:hypothetical protein
MSEMICLFNVEINLFNAIILSIEHMFVMEETYAKLCHCKKQR